MSESKSLCPRCQQAGKTVEIKTVEHQLNPEFKTRLAPQNQYFFCRTATCPVVYFGEVDIFLKTDVRFPVFQKEPDNLEVNVCYCFNHSQREIKEDAIKNGKSTVSPEIKNKVAAHQCTCEISNPQGSCCLGNVALVVQKALASAK